MGGAIDIDPTRRLSPLEATALTLTSLGYTAMQASEIAGVSLESITNRISYVNRKLDTTHTGASSLITESVRQGVVGISQACPSPSTLTVREQRVWDAISVGLTNDAIARKEAVSTRYISTLSSQIYDKLGITNRVAATLLRRMAFDESRPPHFTRSGSSTDGRITEVEFKGGLAAVLTESTLNKTESDLLILRATGHSALASIAFVFGDAGEAQRKKAHAAFRNAKAQYSAETTTEMLRNVAFAGHLVLKRECVHAGARLSKYEERAWESVVNDSFVKEQTRQPGSDDKVRAIYTKLGVNGKMPALLRRLMTYPIPAMWPAENTYRLRQQHGLVLPHPRDVL